MSGYILRFIYIIDYFENNSCLSRTQVVNKLMSNCIIHFTFKILISRVAVLINFVLNLIQYRMNII